MTKASYFKIFDFLLVSFYASRRYLDVFQNIRGLQLNIKRSIKLDGKGYSLYTIKRVQIEDIY